MPSCSASQFAVTMDTPSTLAWLPDVGSSDPVVKPSMSSFVSPASAMAASAVSSASAPNGTAACRTIGLCA